jgi:DNA-binding PadR family transcriptional regulator
MSGVARDTAGLKPRFYYVLLALAGGARHGLAIARDVEQLSEGLRLWPATLYGTLDELVERRWIRELDDHPADESEKKRFYMLTKSGHSALAAETDRLSSVVRAARTRLRRTGAAS